MLNDTAPQQSARHNRLAYTLTLPAQRISSRIPPADKRVIVHRPVISAMHVVLARPDHLDRRASSFGYVHSFTDEVRRRIRAATKTTAQQRGVNLHLLRL